MCQYRIRPLIVEASKVDDILYNATNAWKRLPKWVQDAYNLHTLCILEDCIEITGMPLALKGDWIILGPNNLIFPCKPNIFELCFEEVK